ncbi:CheR family methyltransferase [Thermosediminibacter oceani]|uniref:MCP methyltransferase, CheR-type n=1 Tax=Thermosediminibacter oceani (strain ATCC BAA-1034 / DSM 16646 / JW/IW-1228P) TaxID=555079 RepID=D9S3E3_THEOJ|nr:protein-glutamate O-methyltransferase CheR [Thermosediminibacter oceani]ADL07920.1 MCP methyltransferase, CheR-type [Thermosediminibacter oceani DSM 16646]
MDGYQEFIVSVKRLTNIDLSLYKEKQMRRRIDSLMKRNNMPDLISYFRLLKQSEKHLKEFLNYITINVSEFFRNPIQWQVLEKDILPYLISSRKVLKVWSSACASGEEAYSLALLFEKINYDRVEILATDIDDEALEAARLGVYSEKSVENIPENLKKRYFTVKEGQYAINDEIKRKVKFKNLNLLEDEFPANCHLILCRNVMIYFTEEAKDRLYRKFYNSLADDGVFFVGNTEQIIMPQKYGFVSIKSFFYKKIKL